MKIKNVLLMGLSLVLVAVIAIGGTVAYLTDTDSDVNVMTLGNVKIAQHEYQRATNEDGTYKTATIDNQTSYVLEAFEQGKALLPATDPTNNGAGNWDGTTVRMSQVGSYGGMQVFANSNAQDKFVTVENTGKTDAYVRTLVAIEVGTGSVDLLGISARATDDVNDAGENTPWFKNQIGVVSIDGVNYYMLEYVYAGGKLSNGTYRHANGVLPAGDTTYPNLSQVYLKSAATNEDCEALDGNDNGTLDIIVLSQAVQADGFADAATALNTAFGTSKENAAAWFGGMITNIGATFSEAGEYEIDKAIIFEDETGDNIVANKTGVVVDVNGGYYDAGSQRNNCAVWAYNGGVININDGTFIADGDAAPATSASHLDLIYAGQNGTINIYGGTFSLRNNNGWLLNEKDNTATITVYGGSFLNWNPANNESEGANTSFLASGYTVETENTDEGTWYHVVPVKE